MKIDIITVPFDVAMGEFKKDIIDKNINTRKILNYNAKMIKVGGKYFWSILVEYEEYEGMEKIQKLDKKNEFSEAQKALYQSLVNWRKEKSTTLGLPAYVLCNNAQISDIVRTKPTTKTELLAINGIGEKKVNEYGDDIIKIITDFCKKEKK